MGKSFRFNQKLTDYADLEKDQKYSVNEVYIALVQKLTGSPNYRGRLSLSEDLADIIGYTGYRRITVSQLKSLVRNQVLCPECPKSLTQLDKYDTGYTVQLLVI